MFSFLPYTVTIQKIFRPYSQKRMSEAWKNGQSSRILMKKIWKKKRKIVLKRNELFA